MTTAYSGDGITFPDNTVQATAPRVGMVNRIINGDMRINQRGYTTASPLNAGAGGFLYITDRFSAYVSQTSKMTFGQSTVAPSGFINSLNATTTTAVSVAAGDLFMFNHPIEGLNVADLGWGTANAATVTLSFWVRSSLTGTFGGALLNSANNRSYPFTYTISSANTWEQKSITVAGDTSGTWLTTNGVGANVSFGLGMGSTYSGTAGAWAGTQYWSATGATSVVGTSGATFYITGVQLEKGSTATDFEYVDYGRQLQMCQRYYEKLSGSGGINGTIGNASYVAWYFKVTKRATPTMAFAAGSVITTDYISEDAVSGYRSGSYAYIVAGSTSSAEL